MVNGTELYHLTGTSAYSNNKTGYRGVTLNQKTGRYSANITIAKHMYYLGTFDTPEEAHRAYLDAKEQLHAKILNDPSGAIPTLPQRSRHHNSNRRQRQAKKPDEQDVTRYYQNKSAYSGIYYNKNFNRFTVKKNGIYLGCYLSLDGAKVAYDNGRKIEEGQI
jgi:hypothetical protein